MLNVAVCDDENLSCELVCNHIKYILAEKKLQFKISMYNNGSELLETHLKDPFDVVFLDIIMPDSTGFEIAKRIRSSRDSTYIIFITSKSELVYDSFQYRPFNFIRKGTSEQIKKSLDDVFCNLLDFFKQNEQIVLENEDIGRVSFPMSDIIYIKSEKHYLNYYTKKYVLPFKQRYSINDREQELEAYDFLRIHKQYLINMREIKSYNPRTYVFTLKNDENFFISRYYKDIADEKYTMFLRKK